MVRAELLREAIDAELPLAIDLRQRLHADPRVSGEEQPTRDMVLQHLPAPHGLTKVADTGAIVRVGGRGPAIAVRGELDALDIHEETTVAWRSARAGVMHACGHDVHLAALVALARAVDRVGGPAPLLAILQPREEGYPSGAREIVGSGVLSDERCLAVIGAHVQPILGIGEVGCTPGIVNASSDEFTLIIRGLGGHAAYPHLASDPVITLAHVVVALQSYISRAVDPMSSVVLSVTTLDAGTAPNVIPASAVARGTVRAMNNRDRRAAREQIARVTDLVARAHGCTGEVQITDGEPPLLNDPELAGWAAKALVDLDLQPSDSLRSAGSDDFSYYSEQLPSLMLFVGARDGEERLHSSTFLPANERIRDVAYALLAGYCAAAKTQLSD